MLTLLVNSGSWTIVVNVVVTVLFSFHSLSLFNSILIDLVTFVLRVSLLAGFRSLLGLPFVTYMLFLVNMYVCENWLQ